MEKRSESLLAIALIGLLGISCAAPEPKAAEDPGETESTESAREESSPAPPPAFRLRLRGEYLTASEFTAEPLGLIPFGKWLNGVPVKKVKYGFEFSAALEDCSSYGCVVQTVDNVRVLVSAKGLARGVRLSLYDEGWHRAGSAAINDAGWLAIPMASPEGRQELWIVKDNGHMHKRIPFSSRGAVITRWHGNSRLFIMSGSGTDYRSRRVSLKTGQVLSTTLMDPWWRSCAAGVVPSAVGLAGEVAELIGDHTGLPLYRKGEPGVGWLELTDTVRPMATDGMASPVQVKIDCLGRVNVVTARGTAIWCMRFSPEGDLENVQKIGQGLAGDFRSLHIDSRGRFYYLVTELEDDHQTPLQLRLFRLK